MMRWNSTKTYTENDILRMQQEAVTRVHEFQSRAKSLPFYDVPESAITPYREPAGREAPYEAPPKSVAQQEFPEAFTMPETVPLPDAPAQPMDQQPLGQSQQMNPAMSQPVNQSQPMNEMQQVAHSAPPDPITGLLSKFNLDGETLLILGLMFLLYNEKADNVLLIALAYLLL